jgi:uncharacterized protein YwqG
MEVVTSPNEVLDDLRARARDLCVDQVDPDGVALLEELGRPAIRLRRSEEAAPSHLGGNALLADGVAWPWWEEKPLSLVAVLNLQDLAPFTTDVQLPNRGILNFFYEADEQQAWGFDPLHRDGWRVVYTDSDDAVSTPAPAGALVFPTIALDPEQTLTMPGWEEPGVE